MIEIKSKLEKWGSSFRIIFPKDVVKSLDLKEGMDIEGFIAFPKETNSEK